jgi:hypothetical protein
MAAPLPPERDLSFAVRIKSNPQRAPGRPNRQITSTFERLAVGSGLTTRLRGQRIHLNCATPFLLFDRGHRLAGQPGEGLNFSFQGERLSREFPVLQRIPVSLGSATAPCIRQTSRAPDRRRGTVPARFDLARRLDARCIRECIGLIL